MNRLLVIGGASFDVLHLKDRTVESVGGAGMYTAMAASRCGAQVSMFAPQPDPFPEILIPVADHLSEWLGPVVLPAQLPQIEISYRGGKTEYLKLFPGADGKLSPDLLPEDMSIYDLVHVTPLGDAVKQSAMIEACRQRGAQKISAGTGLTNTDRQPEVVGAVTIHFPFRRFQPANLTQPARVTLFAGPHWLICFKRHIPSWQPATLLRWRLR
jgi:hypothetical protein